MNFRKDICHLDDELATLTCQGTACTKQTNYEKYKDLGIWMDHQTAHLMEFTTDPIQTTTIDSEFTHEEKEQTLSRSENLMHNKEQHEQAAYYKEMGGLIRGYDEVIYEFVNSKLIRVTTAENAY